MKYDSLSRNTVKITLTGEDMREYSLSAESITPDSAETKRCLSRMLRKMKLFQGYRADRLFLEAFPKSDGGCVLYVSSLFEESTEKPVDMTVMCGVGSLQTLTCLCRAAVACGLRSQSCVYHSCGEYLLVAVCENEEHSRLKRLFCEFGRASTDTAEICAVREYAVPVCTADAYRIFSQLC